MERREGKREGGGRRRDGGGETEGGERGREREQRNRKFGCSLLYFLRRSVKWMVI